LQTILIYGRITSYRKRRPNPARKAFKYQNRKEGTMLILTRKIDQGIVIDGNIVILVLGVERDRVKLGFTAPEEVKILRKELLEEPDEGETETGEVGSEQKD
jgi:carbon storage regulator